MRESFLKKVEVITGKEFEKLVDDIFRALYPKADYDNIDDTDGGLDGYIISEEIGFAVFGPEKYDYQKAKNKFETDLGKIEKNHLKRREIKKMILVINHSKLTNTTNEFTSEFNKGIPQSYATYGKVSNAGCSINWNNGNKIYDVILYTGKTLFEEYMRIADKERQEEIAKRWGFESEISPSAYLQLESNRIDETYAEDWLKLPREGNYLNFLRTHYTDSQDVITFIAKYLYYNEVNEKLLLMGYGKMQGIAKKAILNNKKVIAQHTNPIEIHEETLERKIDDLAEWSKIESRIVDKIRKGMYGHLSETHDFEIKEKVRWEK